MNWFKQLVSDGEQPSTTRILLLIIVLVWAVLSIRQNTIVIPDGRVIGFFGTLFGAKLGQSALENFSPPSPKPETKTP